MPERAVPGEVTRDCRAPPRAAIARFYLGIGGHRHRKKDLRLVCQCVRQFTVVVARSGIVAQIGVIEGREARGPLIANRRAITQVWVELHACGLPRIRADARAPQSGEPASRAVIVSIALQCWIVASLSCTSVNIVAGQRDKTAGVSSLRGRCAAQEQHRHYGETPSLVNSYPVSHCF